MVATEIDRDMGSRLMVPLALMCSRSVVPSYSLVTEPEVRLNMAPLVPMNLTEE